MKKFITTAIPYVNSIPHIGFALEIVQTDVLARFYRQFGSDVYFASGTDENSFKIARSAIEQGVSSKELVRVNSQKFYELKNVLNISFNDFIRTTEKRHFDGAQKFWQAMNPDDIYVAKWDGWYCVGCEAHYKKDELLDNNKCPEHLREAEHIEENNYFFRIDKYKNKIKELIENKKLLIVPDKRKQEILNLLDKFHDFNISRHKKYDWGISVPNDPSQIIYPWVEALTNYINVVDYAYDGDNFKKWWVDNNVDIIHVIGKGITKFHAIYWPAMLLSAGIRLPNKILVHGYLTNNGQKISKSLGNVISPVDVVNKYGTDATRYFLLREFSSLEDGDFSYKKLEDRYNGDLANNLGNLVSRVAKLIETKLSGELNFDDHFLDEDISDRITKTEEKYKKAVEEFKLNEAMTHIWDLFTFANLYISEEKPWADNENSEHFLKTLTILIALIINATRFLQPFLPETAEKIFKTFGFNPEDHEINGYKFQVSWTGSLFPRIV